MPPRRRKPPEEEIIRTDEGRPRCLVTFEIPDTTSLLNLDDAGVRADDPAVILAADVLPREIRRSR